MAGIRKEDTMAREALDAPPYRRAGHRLPWLLAGLAGSMVSAIAMSNYEDVLNKNVAIAFFIPAIVYLADAVGTQTEAIAVRGISLSRAPFRSILYGEAKAGIIIGIVLSLLSFPFVVLLYGMKLAIAVSVSIALASAVAATIGLAFPWMLSKLKIDPAFGSGPLATIIQDLLSILIYFSMVSWLF